MSITLDVKITNTQNVSNMLQRISQKLGNIPKEAYAEFVKRTPVRSGNAKNKTKLKGQTIHADYQYAGVLDKGRHMTNKGMRGSTQAPQGMSKPTVDFIKNRVKQIVRGR